jgi:hypothetical protein
MKKMISAITILGLLAALLVSCTKSASTESATTEGASTPENNSISTTTISSGLANNSTVTSPSGTTSGTLQSGLPLSITEPADSATINGDAVTVQGTTAPGATVSVNDNVVTADSTGAFSTNVSLDAGPNAIDVIATDDNNNQGEVLLMVDAMPTTSTTLGASQGTLPLTITSPIDSATLSTSTVIVQGQTTPGATVTANSNSDVADANGNFSIDVSLENGPNAIDVIATDDSGNQGEVLLVVNNMSGS